MRNRYPFFILQIVELLIIGIIYVFSLPMAEERHYAFGAVMVAIILASIIQVLFMEKKDMQESSLLRMGTLVTTNIYSFVAIFITILAIALEWTVKQIIMVHLIVLVIVMATVLLFWSYRNTHNGIR